MESNSNDSNEPKQPSRAGKLGAWLMGQGLTPEGGAKPGSPHGGQKAGHPNDHRAKRANPSSSTPAHPKPKAGGGAPPRGKKPARGGKGSGRPLMGGKPGKNDPFLHRPTVEKRERFHPTNFLPPIKAGEIRVVPLGGMEQVGANMMFLEWGDDIMIIDTGLLFPSPEHLGVDVLVPDISYLIANKHRIRGIVYTHGHLDHVGGAPYILPELGFPPMFASRLTKELLLSQVEEHGYRDRMNVQEITPRSKIKLGRFECEFFHINHSIPDGLAVVVNTPYGAIVHTSDFKFDYSPADDQPIDLTRIAEIGHKGVALAMSDSTNALKSGHTVSERVIEESLAKIVQDTKGRLIVATFASNIGRMSKLIEAAEADGRTVFVSGRSMERNIAIARKLNYLRCKDATIQRVNNRTNNHPPQKTLILTTGSQGEELAALTRMASGIHKDIKITPEDTVVFSSSPIPGNEMQIVSVLNNLAEIGAKIVDHRSMDIHVSGHGYADECKLMASLLNPKYFAPIHGEIFMRYGHRDMIVRDLQFKRENTFIMKNGQGLVLGEKGARLMPPEHSIAGAPVMIELGERVHDDTLAERTQLSESGIILAMIEHKDGTVKKVHLRPRGFVFMNAEHEVMGLLEKEMRETFTRSYAPERSEQALVDTVRSAGERLLLQKFRKSPLIEVVLM